MTDEAVAFLAVLIALVTLGFGVAAFVYLRLALLAAGERHERLIAVFIEFKRGGAPRKPVGFRRPGVDEGPRALAPVVHHVEPSPDRENLAEPHAG